MELNYELTKEDFIDFNMYHIKNSKSVKRTVFIQRYIVSLIFLAFPVLMWSFTKNISGAIYIICPLFWVVWILFYDKAFYKKMGKKINKMAEKNISSGIIGKHNISIDNGELIEKTSSGCIKNKIKDIRNIKETEEHIYIYISDTNAYVIPKRAFKSKDNLNKFKLELNIK